MLESEYHELIRHLDTLAFRIPQSGIRFKYGQFLAESLVDIQGKELYSIRKDNTTFLNNSAHLYPKHPVGFTIRDMDMPFRTLMEFIREVQEEKSSRGVWVSESFITRLLSSAKERCPICLEDYTLIDGNKKIHLFACGYHTSHEVCIEEYKDTKCPVCRI